jgi:hypothetical protein
VGWGEAVDLADAALADSGTELYAAVAGWRYPASMTDLVLMSAAVQGESGERVMPWYQPPEMPTEDEIAAAHAELLEEIQFA